MTPKEIVEFTKELEQLKNITRTAWTSSGRQESVAEHSWRLCMMCLAFEGSIEGVDFGKAIRMCLIHDLGEAYGGDVSAKFETDHEGKLSRERAALSRLLSKADRDFAHRVFELWGEYNEGLTKEALVAKSLDKIETIIQHNQGKNPDDFDYAFNIGYGKNIKMPDELIASVRSIIDEETRLNAQMHSK